MPKRDKRQNMQVRHSKDTAKLSRENTQGKTNQSERTWIMKIWPKTETLMIIRLVKAGRSAPLMKLAAAHVT